MRSFLIIYAVLVSLNLKGQKLLNLKNGAGIFLDSGILMTINGGLHAEDGTAILNNGTIKLKNNTSSNQANWEDLSSSGILSGTGTVVFESLFPQSVSGATQFYNLEINNAGLQLPDDVLRIQNKLTLTNGKIGDAGDVVQIFNSDAVSIEEGPGNNDFLQSYVLGTVERSIAVNSDTYIFPVGGVAQSNPLHFINRNLSGYTKLRAQFSEPKSGTDDGLMVVELGTPYTAVKTEGVWLLNPTGTGTGGAYDLLLYFNGFSSLQDNQFGILRRPNGSSSGADWIVPTGSVLPPGGLPGRIVAPGYARRNNLTGFSQFGIGITSDPLPLRLVSFQGRAVNNVHDLQWETTDEVNTDYFILERSNSFAQSFLPLSVIRAKGYSAQKNQYQYTDSIPLRGDNFYRLKIVDQDDSYYFSGIVRLNRKTNSFFTLYPNPVIAKTLFIGMGSIGNSRSTIRVTDLQGRLFLQRAVDISVGFNRFELNVELLPKGIFYVSVIQEGEITSFSSFIRQ